MTNPTPNPNQDLPQRSGSFESPNQQGQSPFQPGQPHKITQDSGTQEGYSAPNPYHQVNSQPHHSSLHYGGPVPGQTPQKTKQGPALAITAFVLALAGFLFGVIPGIMILGWVLLTVAFVLSIVAIAIASKRPLSIAALAISIVGSIASVIVLIAVVGSVLDEVGSSETVTEILPQSEASVTITEEEEPEVDEGTSSPVFGETFVWDDGLSLTIEPPQEVQLSEYNVEHYDLDSVVPLAFQVTVTNGTDETIESNLFFANLVSGGKEAEAIFDSKVGTESPSTPILPEKSLSYRITFAAEDPSDLQLSWEDFSDFVNQRDIAIFVN